MKCRNWIAAGYLMSFLCATGTQAADTFLEQAESLVKAGKFTEAYQMLSSKERQYAGNFEYDFLLGVSALDAGMPQVSIFALERAVATRPDDANARVAIARNYYVLGERLSAKQEFQTARQKQLPPEVLTGVERYLAALEAPKASQSGFSGYVGVAVGYDDNINSATEETQIFIPAFAALGMANLSAAAREQGDEYMQFSAGFGYRHQLNESAAIVAGVNLSQKVHFSADDLDIGVYSGSLGYVHASGADKFSVAVQGQIFTVGYDQFRRAYGLSGQWDHALSDTFMVGAFAQVLDLDYPDQPIRDAVRYSGGASAVFKFGSAAKSAPGRVLLRANVGTEDEKASARPDLGHNFWGGSATVAYSLNAETSVRATAAYENRNYGGTDPLFLTGRSDDNWSLSGAVNYQLTDSISLVPELSYSRNKSNIVINDYDRFTAQVGLRLSF
ncbi:surface lipoprotein assembly modifier [Kordiimonas pumila]|uniref:Surface lipoprotein assembly modifier n=1 Tax=Kordiimonas pumila TaxID=2161677 RepID=A0ABV7D702_9PROT|nr:surface lipoprotein assembly modifier [Kordiimonas pumila]